MADVGQRGGTTRFVFRQYSALEVLQEVTLHYMIIALGPADSSEPNQDRTTPDPHKRSVETTPVGKLNALHRPVTLQ